MPSQFGLHKVLSNFEVFKRTVPVKIGNMAVNFFRSSFEQQGWTDETFKAWDERKKNKYKKVRGATVTNPILVKSGALRRAVNSSLKSATFQAIDFNIDRPYAAVHNYGLRAGRGAGFMMKQRKFIGRSKQLERRIVDEINKELDRSKVNI